MEQQVLPESEVGTNGHSIAIVGIGCRFPGAEGPERFWRLLRIGTDAIGTIPRQRLAWRSGFANADPVVHHGGFLTEVDEFDCDFFGISPREALQMDPQQRILLEVTWEAFEDAGIVPRANSNSRSGVFIGACYNDYEDLALREPQALDLYTITGSSRSTLAGRLSYFFDFRGPSITVDTACSSSLAAVHLACRALRNGEADLAVGGGTNLILQPGFSLSFLRSGMLAHDGRCKFGDARADGFVRSEGVGVILLKRLADAIASKDRVYAVILGGAIGNDGKGSSSLAQPAKAGQESVLMAALDDAGVAHGAIQYVEAHGTGTSVGDPIELAALASVIGPGRLNDPCFVGSVKTNIGHTEGAAGIAGVIKVALALKHQIIPPSLHFCVPTPEFPWSDSGLAIQTKAIEWPARKGTRCAGVSSFGIGGTNVHLLLGDGPREAAIGEKLEGIKFASSVLPISARSGGTLVRMVESYIEYLNDERSADFSPEDICYTAGVCRTHHGNRVGVEGSSREAILSRLKDWLTERTDKVRSPATVAHPKIVFVFPGQGSQWLGMGRQLFQTQPVFKEAVHNCDEVIQRHFQWSIIRELNADKSTSRLDKVDIVQPAIFAIQVALAALWRSWGVEPSAVIGHSMGEVGAAFVAGALTLDDAVKVICERSRLVRTTSGRGGMAVVELSFADAKEVIKRYGRRLTVAAQNGPRLSILSGDLPSLKEVLSILEAREVFCRWIKVDYASHSTQMDGLLPQLRCLLSSLSPLPNHIPFFSTVSASLQPGTMLDADYWTRNLRETVLFWRSVKQLVKAAHNVFLEISPHPVLLNSLEGALSQMQRDISVVASLRRDQDENAMMMDSLARMYSLGTDVNWSEVYPKVRKRVPLPSYSWDHQKLWLESTLGSDERSSTATDQVDASSYNGSAPLALPCGGGLSVWETPIGLDSDPLFKEHLVKGAVVVPASFYVDQALSAAFHLQNSTAGNPTIRRLTFDEALFLPNAGRRLLQMTVATRSLGNTVIEFFSRDDVKSDRRVCASDWVKHATGSIDQRSAVSGEVRYSLESFDEILDRCPYELSQEAHYEALNAIGLGYGPMFQCVKHLWLGKSEALARLDPQTTSANEIRYRKISPALLDSAFQSFGAIALRSNRGGRALLPVRIDSIRWFREVDGPVWCHALQRSNTPNDLLLEGDVTLYDSLNRAVLEVRGLRLREIELGRYATHEPLYVIQWNSSSISKHPVIPILGKPTRPETWILFGADDPVASTVHRLLRDTVEQCVRVDSGPHFKQIDKNHFVLDALSPDHFDRLLANLSEYAFPPLSSIVHLWSLDPGIKTGNEPILAIRAARNLGSMSVLHLIQSLVRKTPVPTPRLFVVTRGAQGVRSSSTELSVFQSPLIGLRRVIAQEHPEFRCSSLDIPIDSQADFGATVLEQLLNWPDGEDEIALREEGCLTPRLVPHLGSSPSRSEELPLPRAGDRAYHLSLSKRSAIANCEFQAHRRAVLRDDEVELAVRTSSLNYRDVLLARGILQSGELEDPPLGWDCAGVVAAKGKAATKYRVGDPVYGIATRSIANFASTKESLLALKPDHLTFEKAACLPIVCLTAHYALSHVARLKRNERVLIHSATGGVGLAAIWYAKRLGAEIYATAGSDRKRQYLRSIGIQHVFDSRSLAFVEEIRAATQGVGVNVILNSLAGSAIPANLQLLAPRGRFLELGKVDIQQDSPLGMSAFSNNIAFFAIDLSEIIRNEPEIAGSLLQEAIAPIERAPMPFMPYKAFRADETSDAFTFMARGEHIGKVLVTGYSENQRITMGRVNTGITEDATYLITGGTGGLGTAFAEWLAREGARHIVLVSRGRSHEQTEIRTLFRELGVEVIVASADVARREELEKVFEMIHLHMPPLRGVIHAAGVLDDAVLCDLDVARFEEVARSKVEGAWLLHELTLNKSLDFLIFCSSVAAVLGSPGQGNYAAANQFLDALAHHRRFLSLPAVSINWGPWTRIGLAAQRGRADRLAGRGLSGLEPENALRLFRRCITDSPSQMIVAPIDAAQWSRTSAGMVPILGELLPNVRTETPSHAGDSRTAKERLSALPLRSDRRELLETVVLEQVAKVLKFDAARLDPTRSAVELGLDSLMAVEVRHRLASELDITLATKVILGAPTLFSIVDELLVQFEASHSVSPISSVQASA
jgi:myxalamid-type polyketide synthase MxaB